MQAQPGPLPTEPVVSPETREAARLLRNPALAQSQPVVQPRARILYVDAAPVNRSRGEWVLVAAGYEVDTAADGAEAWVALQETNYHLLITDNDMPRLTGLELATQARRAGMRLPIILTSGAVSPRRDPAFERLALAAFLAKPVASHVLIETIAQVLHAANSARQCRTALISKASRVQPFPHGGINE